jgi:hypothetical protein
MESQLYLITAILHDQFRWISLARQGGLCLAIIDRKEISFEQVTIFVDLRLVSWPENPVRLDIELLFSVNFPFIILTLISIKNTQSDRLFRTKS